MSKASTPAPKSNAPIGAYPATFTRYDGNDKPQDYSGFAAYDATGRAWQVDADTAEKIGIRSADPALFPTLKPAKVAR